MRDQGRIDTAAYHKNYRYIIDVLKSEVDQNINNILETNIHNGSDLTKLFSSYVMCRLNK